MVYKDVVEHFGGLSKAARALKLPRQTIHAWKRKHIPFEQQFRIQLKTKGHLKASLRELLKKQRRV